MTRIHFTILTLAFGMIVHALYFAGIVFKLGGEYGKGMFYVGYGGSSCRDSRSWVPCRSRNSSSPPSIT